MAEHRSSDLVDSGHPWPLVMCLVGVDYFSTLAYLPSIAVEAAGPLAPVAAAGVVLATFLLAVPVYWYLVGRASDGRGATGMLQELIPGWRGKFVVLTLLGFAAADFVITRSLSLADAAIHLLHNPHGQNLLERLPAGLLSDDAASWPSVEYVLRLLLEPQVALTLGLSILSFGLWQLLKRGVTRRVLLVAAAAVSCYLALAGVVIGSAAAYIARHPTIWQGWFDAIVAPGSGDGATASFHEGWYWPWLGVALWSFPQMALGLSGFEMIMTVLPRVAGGAGDAADQARQRVRNARKLMVAVAGGGGAALGAMRLSSLSAAQGEILPFKISLAQWSVPQALYEAIAGARAREVGRGVSI